MPVLLQYLRTDLFQLGGNLPVCTRLQFLFIFIAALAYLVSPIDLIPELIFGIFGYADDIFALFYAMFYAATLYRTFIVNLGEQQQQ